MDTIAWDQAPQLFGQFMGSRGSHRIIVRVTPDRLRPLQRRVGRTRAAQLVKKHAERYLPPVGAEPSLTIATFA